MIGRRTGLVNFIENQAEPGKTTGTFAIFKLSGNQRQKIEAWLGRISSAGCDGEAARLLFGLGLARALCSECVPPVLYADLPAGSGIVSGAAVERFGVEPFCDLADEMAAEDIVEELHRVSVVYGATEPGRKRSGSYYTPAELARELARRVSGRLSVGDGPVRQSRLKVIDPACGPGIVLLALNKCLEESGVEADYFGIDLDPGSVFLTRFYLYRAGLSADIAASRVVCGDALRFFVEGDSPFVTVSEYAGDTVFDVVVGNPPWEIHKPNTREFFSLYDPDFYSYPRQKALVRQQEIFSLFPDSRKRWEALNCSYAENARFYKRAFLHQGGGDANFYKYFIEQSFRLVADGGLISLIVPGGLYCDSGSAPLRRLLIEKAEWLLLRGFENSNAAFDIHRSFKYCYFVARKGGVTKAIDVDFFSERKPDAGGDGAGAVYDAQALKRFSPRSNIILEVEGALTLELLDKIYCGSSSQYLGESVFGDFPLRYRREFDMTMDSSLFVARDALEQAGFRSDLSGNWLAGSWRRLGKADTDSDIEGAIISACGDFSIMPDSVQSIRLPLYEGRMIGPYDFRKKKWLEGSGRGAIWREKDFENSRIEPHYLIDAEAFAASRAVRGLKTGFLAVGSDTNRRSMMASLLFEVPCGNSVPVLYFEGEAAKTMRWQLVLTAILNSFVFDFVLRRRMAGTNLNYFVIAECPLPDCRGIDEETLALIVDLVALLNMESPRYSMPLSQLGLSGIGAADRRTHLSSLSRKIVMSLLDVFVLRLYDLAPEDLFVILQDSLLGEWATGRGADFVLNMPEPCLDELFERALIDIDRAPDLESLLISLSDSDKLPPLKPTRSYGVNPKGFHRVDRELPVWQRQTAISMLLAYLAKGRGQAYLKGLARTYTACLRTDSGTESTRNINSLSLCFSGEQL
ncbi:N-6 DNA methylase [bacterium]|nr:N-6 DNA methylase [bacterium]